MKSFKSFLLILAMLQVQCIQSSGRATISLPPALTEFNNHCQQSIRFSAELLQLAQTPQQIIQKSSTPTVISTPNPSSNTPTTVFAKPTKKIEEMTSLEMLDAMNYYIQENDLNNFSTLVMWYISTFGDVWQFKVQSNDSRAQYRNTYNTVTIICNKNILSHINTNYIFSDGLDYKGKQGKQITEWCIEYYREFYDILSNAKKKFDTEFDTTMIKIFGVACFNVSAPKTQCTPAESIKLNDVQYFMSFNKINNNDNKTYLKLARNA